MIHIIRPNKDNYLPLKHIFDRYKEQMDADEFGIVANCCNCMFFFSDEDLIGCIYLYPKEDKVFVNAFATRGHHKLNLHILKAVLDTVNFDVYAEPLNKSSKLCILRLGFEKFKDNIYIYKGVKNGR